MTFGKIQIISFLDSHPYKQKKGYPKKSVANKCRLISKGLFGVFNAWLITCSGNFVFGFSSLRLRDFERQDGQDKMKYKQTITLLVSGPLK